MKKTKCNKCRWTFKKGLIDKSGICGFCQLFKKRHGKHNKPQVQPEHMLEVEDINLSQQILLGKALDEKVLNNGKTN